MKRQPDSSSAFTANEFSLFDVRASIMFPLYISVFIPLLCRSPSTRWHSPPTGSTSPPAPSTSACTYGTRPPADSSTATAAQGSATSVRLSNYHRPGRIPGISFRIHSLVCPDLPTVSGISNILLQFDCRLFAHNPQVASSRCAGTAAATRWARPTARAPYSYSTSGSERGTDLSNSSLE